MIRINLFKRFIIAFISVGVLPLLFVSFYSAYLIHREAAALMEENYRQAVLYSARNLESILEKYNTISKLLYSYNPENNNIIRTAAGIGLVKVMDGSAADEAEQMRRYNEAIKFLRLIQNSDAYITNVIFKTSAGTYYSLGKNNYPFVNESEFSRLAAPPEGASLKANQLRIIPPHRDSYFQRSDNQVFTVERNYIDITSLLGSDRIIGTLYIDVDIQSIENIFRHLDIYQNSKIAVFDSDNTLIYGNPVYYSKKLNGGSALAISRDCENFPWRIVLTVDPERVTARTDAIIRIISLLMVIVLTALLSASVLYSRGFSNPVRLMLAEMKKVEQGDFNVQVKIKARDELGELADGFNQMAAKLEAYIQTSLIARIKQKEAELSSLKMKIKPHFLYNSLELIRMSAIAHDDDTTADLVFLLAELMRASIDPPYETVTLKQEMDMIRNYLAFIDLRGNHEITWEIDYDPSLGDVQVLNLMLQPLVENSVIHGIHPKGRGHIRIAAEKRGGDLTVTVSDDGIGMDEELVEKLNAQLQKEYQEKDEGHDSIGLKNVHDRLRYKYGEPYGVIISAAAGSGAVITITLPRLVQPDSRF